MTNEETQLASYFAQYEPAIARLGKTLRAKLRTRLPGLIEVVYLYESQDQLLIAYSPSGRGYDAPCSLGLFPDRVCLFFGRGAELPKSDPEKRLQGSGKTVRHVVLSKAADLDRAEIQALVAAALKLAKLRLDPSAKSSVIFKVEAQKLRAERARKAARPAAPRRKARTRR